MLTPTLKPRAQVATAKEKEAERERLRAERRAQKEAEAAEKQVIISFRTSGVKVPSVDSTLSRTGRVPHWYHEKSDVFLPGDAG